MIDRDDRDRVRAFAQPLEALGHDGGGEVGSEIDDGPRAKLVSARVAVARSPPNWE